MKERESLEVQEMRERVYREQGGTCFHCGFPMEFSRFGFELAHLVPQRGWCIRRWGKDAVHHRRNMVGTHPGRCNSAVEMNVNGIPAEDLMRSIREEIEYDHGREHRGKYLDVSKGLAPAVPVLPSKDEDRPTDEQALD